VCTGFSWQAILNTAVELSCSIKDGEFLDKLSDCQFLKKDSAPLKLGVILHRTDQNEIRSDINFHHICRVVLEMFECTDKQIYYPHYLIIL